MPQKAQSPRQDGSTPTNTGSPAAAEATAAVPKSGFVGVAHWKSNDRGQGSGLMIQNEAADGAPICAVYVRQTTAAPWGDNRLKRSLAVGESRGMALAPGSWMLKLEDCKGCVLHESGAFELGENEVDTFAYSTAQSSSCSR